MEQTAIARRLGFLAGLFTFSGRARRADVLLLTALGMLAGLFSFTLTGFDLHLPAIAFASNAFWAFLWIAMLVRRLHDQDRPGWWAALLLGTQTSIVIALAFLPRRDLGSPSIGYLSWTIHPVPGPLTIPLMLTYLAIIFALIALLFWQPSIGPNRYGPDPRLDAEGNAAWSPQ